MIIRLGVTALALTGISYFSIAPAEHLLGNASATSVAELGLVDAPGQAPSLAAWPTGVFDSSSFLARTEGISTTSAQIPPPRTLRAKGLTVPSDVDLYVGITGEPITGQLPGIGARIQDTDVQRLFALDEETRSDDIADLTGLYGASLGLAALGDSSAADAFYLTSNSSAAQKEQLERFPLSRDLLAALVQDRPDLSVALPTSSSLPGAVNGSVPGNALSPADVNSPDRLPRDSRAYLAASGRIVRDEILGGLGASQGVISPALLTTTSEAGLFEITDGRLAFTTRGALYSVAAHAVAPGSFASATKISATSKTAYQVGAFLRPDGGTSLLAWNPGPAASISIDAPVGAKIARFSFSIPGGALTAVVLPKLSTRP